MKEEAGRKEETLKEKTAELEDEEIERQIKKLKKGMTAGEGNVQNEACLFSEGEAKKQLRERIKAVWRGEGYPSRRRKGVILPFFKKGDQNLASNYRGITLLDLLLHTPRYRQGS